MQKTLSVIDLQAIRRNALKIRSVLGKRKFFAVVKADAYGHGGEEVSRAIEDVVDYFCVAIMEEGVKLRVAGVSKPVLVFTPPLDGYAVDRAAFYNLTLTVNSVQTAKLACGLPCHIKVNTGMNRNGCNLTDLADVLSALDKSSVSGVYSHLYAPKSAFASERQLALFNAAEKAVKEVCPNSCAHISASGGLLRGGAYLKDGARCGILLYGYAFTVSSATSTPTVMTHAPKKIPACMDITPFLMVFRVIIYIYIILSLKHSACLIHIIK